MGVSMTNGTRHDPCIPRHWAMRCPAWTSTRTSHNRVFNKIRPNTDVASISGVLHLVWPLAQSLSSMVVPTRSQNSSWYSLWDLRGTQAPQLRQSNNTLGGRHSLVYRLLSKKKNTGEQLSEHSFIFFL